MHDHLYMQLFSIELEKQHIYLTDSSILLDGLHLVSALDFLDSRGTICWKIGVLGVCAVAVEGD